MSLSASEFFEAGMGLPAEVRRQVALRLLESTDVTDGDAVVEEWLRTEVVAAYDAVVSDPSQAIPIQDVRAELATRWAAGR